MPQSAKDSPAAAAKPLPPRADLAIGKPQNPGHEQRREKQRPTTGSAMNTKLPAYQCGSKGKNGRTP